MARTDPSQEAWREAKAERVRRESGKKHRRRVLRVIERQPERAQAAAVDPEQLLADLRASDEATRAKAVRSVCPCRLGWETFQETMDTLKERAKDASPHVRAQALHVFEDAYGMQARESREAEKHAQEPDQDAIKRDRQQGRKLKRETTAVFGRGPRPW
jgi:hypothetical protein